MGYSNQGHQFIYDFDTIKLILEENGFKNIRKTAHQEGQNPDLLIYTDHRRFESLYVEFQK